MGTDQMLTQRFLIFFICKNSENNIEFLSNFTAICYIASLIYSQLTDSGRGNDSPLQYHMDKSADLKAVIALPASDTTATEKTKTQTHTQLRLHFTGFVWDYFSLNNPEDFN